MQRMVLVFLWVLRIIVNTNADMLRSAKNYVVNRTVHNKVVCLFFGWFVFLFDLAA